MTTARAYMRTIETQMIRRINGEMTVPELNRRRFLQSVSAASLLPVLPTLPAAAATAPGAATSAQMLWAGIHAKSGSAAGFASVARTMGISNQAALGVQAKLVHSNVLAARSLSRVARPVATPPKPRRFARSTKSRDLRADFERWIDDEPEDLKSTDDQSIQGMDEKPAMPDQTPE